MNVSVHTVILWVVTYCSQVGEQTFYFGLQR